MALNDPAAADPDVLYHAPIAVLLAVFEASFAAHEHVQSVWCFASQIKGVRSALHAVLEKRSPEIRHFPGRKIVKLAETRAELRKSG